jgi:hypothetical protein
MTLNLKVIPENLALPVCRDAQVCYVLVNIDAHGRTLANRSVNWALVADASRSMRIPIISEEQFRQLVRDGGAHEVLVDGVPVWQFNAPVPPEIDAVSPNALDHVAQALYSIVEHLQHADRFALVACAEDAVVLAPGTSGIEREVLSRHIDRLKGLDLGEETDLSRGLHLGLEQLRQGRGDGTSRVERVLLLTDGFTRHPDMCLHLARQAAAQGVSVSTLGVGGDFQADVLTALADETGGRAVFLRHAEEIPNAVAHELAAARAVAARAVTLNISLSEGVKLRRATSISPTLAVLEAGHRPPNVHMLRLGDVQQQQPVSILLELLAPPSPPLNTLSARRVRLAQMRLENASNHPVALLDLIGTFTLSPAPPPAPVLDAAARANAARLQRRALEAANRGDREEAVALMRAAAARLHEMGESALAGLATQEAAALEQTGKTTRLGAKELTYATRRLGKG